MKKNLNISNEELLKLEPTKENPLDIADRDEKKSLTYWENILKEENLETTEENIFIAAACADKGIEFLKGETKVNVRKKSGSDDVEASPKKQESSGDVSSYTILLDGEKYNVQVAPGTDINITAAPSKETNQVQETKTNTPSGSGNNVVAPVNGVVVKIVANPGDSVSADQTIVILESMKMEIEVKAGSNGKLSSVNITKGQNVEEGQPIFTLE